MDTLRKNLCLVFSLCLVSLVVYGKFIKTPAKSLVEVNTAVEPENPDEGALRSMLESQFPDQYFSDAEIRAGLENADRFLPTERPLSHEEQIEATRVLRELLEASHPGQVFSDRYIRERVARNRKLVFALFIVVSERAEESRIEEEVRSALRADFPGQNFTDLEIKMGLDRAKQVVPTQPLSQEQQAEEERVLQERSQAEHPDRIFSYQPIRDRIALGRQIQMAVQIIAERRRLLSAAQEK